PLQPAKRLASGSKFVGSLLLELDARPLLHFLAEHIDTHIEDSVLKAGMSAVDPVSKVTLCRHHSFRDRDRVFLLDIAEDVTKSGESLLITVGHAHPATCGHI